MLKLTVIVDKQNAGFYFIKPGHTHTVYYQELTEGRLIFHMEQINELLSLEDVELNRQDVDGVPDLVDGEDEVYFKGIRF